MAELRNDWKMEAMLEAKDGRANRSSLVLESVRGSSDLTRSLVLPSGDARSGGGKSRQHGCRGLRGGWNGRGGSEQRGRS